MALRNFMMSNTNESPALHLRSDFPRKVTVLVLLTIDTAIGIFFLFRNHPEIYLLVRLIFADLCLGLIAGFGTRWLLLNRNLFIRLISGSASLVIGLITVGILTNWQLGLGPLYFGRSSIDWTGLAQITLSMICMYVALNAWSKSTMTNLINPPGTADLPISNPAPAQTRTKQRREGTNPTVSEGTIRQVEPARIEIAANKPVITRRQVTKKNNGLAQKFSLRKPQIKLSKKENHLCPYCLEAVAQKDPRGIVECEICHTLHHGDCWAIAGSCQVPHYTN